MRFTKQRSALALVVFVALTSFIFVLFYQSCGDQNSTSTPEASASPSATGAKNSASVNHAGPQPSPTTAISLNYTIIAKEITGNVKDERSGQTVTEAVVVLFNESKAGSSPQMVNDTSGQFRFKDVPLKVGVTYSLQSKAPGLCGEENINWQAINSQQTINKDINLKPCQTQPNAEQTTRAEEPGLARISDGLNEMRVPLDSMKGWMQILGTISIITLLSVLLATIGFILFVRYQIADTRTQVNHLFDWKRQVETEARKPNQSNEPAKPLLNVPPDVVKILQELPDALNRIATATQALVIQKDVWGTRTEETSQPPAKDSTPACQSPPYQSQEPTDWYRNLLQSIAVSPAPLFVEINTVSSEMSGLVSERRLHFDLKTNHGSFVIHRADDEDGWIFPNPRSTFMADHHKVFEGLDHNNFDQQKTSIKPRKVTFQDGCWQLKL